MKIALFDIDGTLILSGGAGLRAMNESFRQIFGVRNALLNVNMAGRTDTSIIIEALDVSDIPHDDFKLEEFRNRYYDLIAREIKRSGNGKKVMPGVRRLIPELAERQKKGVYLGLLTGNWERSGRIKLAHFGLDRYFTFGAFADDSGDRNELLPFAIERFDKIHGMKARPEDVFVIGDTPADILCARPHGAATIAVGASHYTTKQLSSYQPDYLFEDLSDVDKILEILG